MVTSATSSIGARSWIGSLSALALVLAGACTRADRATVTAGVSSGGVAELALTVAKRQIAADDFGNDLAASVPWGVFNGPFTIVDGVVKLSNSSTSAQSSAAKSIDLNQAEARAIRVAARSRAQQVSDYSSLISYSVRVDVTYSDGTFEKYTHAPFRGGDHDWEEASFVFLPKRPIRTATLIVMLYWRTGTAYFTDATLQEQVPTLRLGAFDDMTVVSQDSSAGYLVHDYGAGGPWYAIASGETGSGWRLEAASTTQDTTTLHSATLTNLGGGSRAGVLAYRLPVSRTGLRWCEEDLRTLTPVDDALDTYANEVSTTTADEKSRPLFLWGCVVSDSSGYAIAVDPGAPAQFRIRYDAGSEELYIVFDLGFSADVTSASVRFASWSFPATHGTRQAISDFYARYPEVVSDRLAAGGVGHGLWFIKDLSSGTLADAHELGLRFNQGDTSSASIAYDNAREILDTRYVHPWEAFIDVRDLTAEQRGSYAAVVAKLDALAAAGDTQAVTAKNAGVQDAAGNYIYHVGAEWSTDYARFLLNPGPNIHRDAYDSDNPATYRNAYDEQWATPAVQNDITVRGMDGIMCDNVEAFYWASAATAKTRIDYDPTHFSGMRTPLVHDKLGRVGIGYEPMIWEYFNGVRADVLGMSRLIVLQANGVPYTSTFLAGKLDILGGEQTWDSGGSWNPPPEARLLRFRAQAGRKLVAFLQNPADLPSWTAVMTEKYFARSCAFGIMPSFFIGASGSPTAGRYFDDPAYYERDRPLFRQYIPVIKKLSEAGWEPVRRASVDDASVFLERFGTRYLTVFNPTTVRKTVKVTYEAAPLSMTGKELISGAAVTWSQGHATLTLAAEHVAVLELPDVIDLKLDEGTGTIARAEAPLALAGSVSGATWTEGLDGKALAFDGIDDSVSVVHDALFDVGEPGFAFGAWIKPAHLNPTGHSMIYLKGGSYVSVNSRRLIFKMLTGGGAQRYCVGTTNLEEGKWYHVAATYDRQGYMRLYLDGEQDGATVGPYPRPDPNTQAAIIGASWEPSFYFNGIIDEVEIYRRALSPAEVRQAKERRMARYVFSFAEGHGTTTADDYDLSKSAVLSGATWAEGHRLFGLALAGTDDFLSVPGSESSVRPDGPNGFSFAAWIKAAHLNPTNHSMVFTKHGDYISVVAGRLYFKLFTGGGGQRYCVGNTLLADGHWYHIAATYDELGYMRVFVNGVQDGATVGPFPGADSTDGHRVEIGASWQPDFFFNGVIDDVKIYGKALNAEEVWAVYEHGM